MTTNIQPFHSARVGRDFQPELLCLLRGLTPDIEQNGRKLRIVESEMSLIRI
jgi:hypothetical protein